MLLVCALALAPGCAPKTHTREVVFWEFAPAAVVQPLLAKFEQAHPGVHVHLEQLVPPDGAQRIAAAVDSGQVPDLVELGPGLLPHMLASGKLVDWSAGTADLKPALRGWELGSIGDAVYGVPWMLDTRALFWNKRLFARAGLDTTRAPATWDALRLACAKIQRLGHGVHGCGVTTGAGMLAPAFLPFVWSSGGDVLSSDGHRAVFDSAATRAALAFYVSLRAVGTVAGQDTLDREFAAGRLGCVISGAWLPARIAHDARGLRYGVADVPARDAASPRVPWAGGEVLASFTQAKQKPLALELARFLVQPENALAVAEGVPGALCAVAGADTSSYASARPAERALLRQFASARFAPNHAAWPDMQAAVEDEVTTALEGRKTVAQAAADAQARLAKLVAGS